MNETFTGAAQVDADASPQADGAPSAARIVTGLSRLPGSFSGRYAARIVTGLRLDCPAPPRAATRPASSPGSGWIARLLLGPLRGPHRHRAQAGLPGSSSGRYAARIVTGLSRLPGSFSGRYAARIVTGLRLDCPAPPRAATRPASSPGSGWIARLLLGPLRGPHRHRAQAGLPGSSSGRYAARIVTGLRLDCPAPPRAATRPASSPG
ncbi:hypothetical protein [Mycobacterium tuberculosis]|uniref:hypothetical protein n=3 Tax=Mycobacterium tuberculosis TaxID=1773 RepID=UPI001F1D74A0|nr:hypothetical protein [Mycobacterium tuberculosis]